MDMVAAWVADTKPSVFVTDVSVEIATFVRLLGVPVVVMALPGKRYDAPHVLVHRLADHIIAAWPENLHVPAWLRTHADKTSFVGGISRFDGRDCPASAEPADGKVNVLVLAGASEGFGAEIDQCERACPGTRWTAIGGADGCWVDDPWPHICAADVVVSHAGQSAVADIAAARRRAVVIPAPRPFNEQSVTADAIRRHRIATVARYWPNADAWPGLIAHALAGDANAWSRWQVPGAAQRAATAIEATADTYADAYAR